MVFKRTPRARHDPLADKVLNAIKEKGADEREASERFQEGKQLEADGEWESAIDEYIQSAAAWERYHAATAHAVPVEPYMRLGVLLRRAKDLDGEIRVLESYLAHAGRDPDVRIQERLARAYELGEPVDEPF